MQSMLLLQLKLLLEPNYSDSTPCKSIRGACSLVVKGQPRSSSKLVYNFLDGQRRVVCETDRRVTSVQTVDHQLAIMERFDTKKLRSEAKVAGCPHWVSTFSGMEWWNGMVGCFIGHT